MKKTLIILFCIISINAQSQQIVPDLLSSAGDYFTSDNYSISWSLGEIAIETFAFGNNIITQGFQQTKLNSSSVYGASNNSAEINVFPNPTVDYLTVKADFSNLNIDNIEIYDISGALMFQQKPDMFTKSCSIDVRNIKPGSYLVVFVSNHIKVKTFLMQRIDL